MEDLFLLGNLRKQKSEHAALHKYAQHAYDSAIRGFNVDRQPKIIRSNIIDCSGFQLSNQPFLGPEDKVFSVNTAGSQFDGMEGST